MQNRWLIETVAELAFVQEPIRLYGYGLEKGIILIADDDESALTIRSMLESHLDAVEVKLRGRKERQPLNYQMGVHVYNRLDDERKVMDFLEEREFFPIVIVGGMIPETLIGEGYAFRCTVTEEEFIEAENQYIRFTDSVKRDVARICNLIKAISKSSFLLNDKQNKYQKYKQVIRNFMTVAYVWEKIGEELEISEAELEEEKDVSGNCIWKAIQDMDR